MSKHKGKENFILQAASKVFMEKGFHKATMEQISQEAGVGKGTIYEYFNNKNELFLSTLQVFLEAYQKLVVEKLKDHEDFVDKINAFVDIHKDLVEENFLSTNFFLENISAPYADSQLRVRICELMFQSRKRIMNIIEEILKKGQDEDKISSIDFGLTSDIFYAMVTRICIRRIQFRKTEEEFLDEKKKLIDMLLNGVKLA